MAKTKKYKLHSGGADANKQSSMPYETNSVVSSESEPEVSKPKMNVNDDSDLPFVSYPQEDYKQQQARKRKNRRSSSSDKNSPFAIPQKKPKTNSNETDKAKNASPHHASSPHHPNSPEKPRTTPSYLNMDLPIATFSAMADLKTSTKSVVENHDSKKPQKVVQENDPFRPHPRDTKSADTVLETRARRSTPSYLNMDLPISPFSSMADPKNSTKVDMENQTSMKPEKVVQEKSLPLPRDTKWTNAVLETRAHRSFQHRFNFAKYKENDANDGICGANGWITARPYGRWSEKLPQAIAIDCEMCETQDPVSKEKNFKALCRVSVIDANTKDVLIDTLVKPEWPVTKYRTFVNGVTEEHLRNVQFSMRHAQAFLTALCSEETVIIGHAVHNDLVALRMEHHCVVDSAALLKATDSPTITVSLKDSVKSLLGKEMPDTHDSVNDAKMALLCCELWVEKGGNVKTIDRSGKSGTSDNSNELNGPQSNSEDALTSEEKESANAKREAYQRFSEKLFMHRIPKEVSTDQIMALFLAHSDVKPMSIDDIDFSGKSGKTHIMFRSGDHANLAFDFMNGSKPKLDVSGRWQKRIYLRNGDFTCIRKMTFARERDGNQKRDTSRSGRRESY